MLLASQLRTLKLHCLLGVEWKVSHVRGTLLANNNQAEERRQGGRGHARCVFNGAAASQRHVLRHHNFTLLTTAKAGQRVEFRDILVCGSFMETSTFTYWMIIS